MKSINTKINAQPDLAIMKIITKIQSNGCNTAMIWHDDPN